MSTRQQNTVRREQMRSIIAQWQPHLQTLDAYCHEHNISKGIFKYWRAELRKESQTQQKTASFVPVSVVHQPIPAQSIAIHYPNGVQVHLQNTADITLLQALVNM